MDVKGCKIIGDTSTTTQLETELLDGNIYAKSYPHNYPRVVGFSIINRGSTQMDIQLNNGDVMTIEAGEGRAYSENVEIFSAKILTNGSIYQWEGILI